MTKPHVSADLMPAALVCYDQHALASEVYDLIQRIHELLQADDWSLIDSIALEVDTLAGAHVKPCERAVALVHYGDLSWKADRWEPALRAYSDAQSIFRVECEAEHRHNEAAAAYGSH